MSKSLRDALKDSFVQQFKVPGKIDTQIERKIINNYLEEEHSTKNKLISFTQEKASLARGFFVCRIKEVFVWIRTNIERCSVLVQQVQLDSGS